VSTALIHRRVIPFFCCLPIPWRHWSWQRASRPTATARGGGLSRAVRTVGDTPGWARRLRGGRPNPPPPPPKSLLAAATNVCHFPPPRSHPPLSWFLSTPPSWRSRRRPPPAADAAAGAAYLRLSLLSLASILEPATRSAVFDPLTPGRPPRHHHPVPLLLFPRNVVSHSFGSSTPYILAACGAAHHRRPRLRAVAASPVAIRRRREASGLVTAA